MKEQKENFRKKNYINLPDTEFKAMVIKDTQGT